MITPRSLPILTDRILLLHNMISCRLSVRLSVTLCIVAHRVGVQAKSCTKLPACS